MQSMRLGSKGSLSLFALAALTLAGCPPPPARSPLKDRLAEADQPTIEAATRSCLDREGWKVDPISDLIAGADVVTAARRNNQTQVFIQAPDVIPRITGGPDDGDEFWTCLAKELEAAKTAPKPAD
jgi:hypothetical protein